MSAPRSYGLPPRSTPLQATSGVHLPIYLAIRDGAVFLRWSTHAFSDGGCALPYLKPPSTPCCDVRSGLHFDCLARVLVFTQAAQLRETLRDAGS